MTTPSLEAIAATLDTLLERTAAKDQRFFGIADAAIYAGLSEESVRRLLSRGTLTALRPVKGKIVIDRHQLDSVILSATSRPRRGRGLRR